MLVDEKFGLYAIALTTVVWSIVIGEEQISPVDSDGGVPSKVYLISAPSVALVISSSKGSS